jgi:hypothetical protein
MQAAEDWFGGSRVKLRMVEYLVWKQVESVGLDQECLVRKSDAASQSLAMSLGSGREPGDRNT